MADRDCPVCADPLTELGLAFDEDRGRLVDTYVCRPCGLDYINDPHALGADERAQIRRVVREVRSGGLTGERSWWPEANAS